MMDGRVKTLHPKIHGGILARRAHPEDLDAADAHAIGLVDLVCVNLYPFVQTAAKPGIAFDELDRADRHRRSEPGARRGQELPRRARRRQSRGLRGSADGTRPRRRSDVGVPLRPRASRVCAHRRLRQRDCVDAGEVRVEDGAFQRAGRHDVRARAARHRRDASFATFATARTRTSRPRGTACDPPAGLGAPTILQGKELSFTNLLDLDAAARIVLEFDEPAACVIKHTNPCGAATGDTIAEAYTRARDADALGGFGGIVGLNRPIDEETARAIVSTFIEAVVAPACCRGRVDSSNEGEHARGHGDFAPLSAARRPRARDALDPRRAAGAAARRGRRSARGVAGGITESRHQACSRRASGVAGAALCVARDGAREVEHGDLHRRYQTRAIGAGQMSRVDAVKVATMKAAGWDSTASRAARRHRRRVGCVLPVPRRARRGRRGRRDGRGSAGGSVRDAEVIAAADEHGLAMVFTGRRHFRH